MSCLHEAVNAKIVYGNIPNYYNTVQYVYGIRYIDPKSGAWIKDHKDWPACYAGITRDARSLSRTNVYSLSNFGPFYEWWEWTNLLNQRGLITNFQAVIDKVWTMSEEKGQPEERVRDLKDAWIELQLSNDKAEAIRRLRKQERPVYQEVLGYLEGGQ